MSRYALGRDYHQVLRTRLQALADRIAADIGPFGYRVFTDSAPVMEVALAANAGTGWRGKHTLLLTREGSLFFLGELYTDLPLPVTQAVSAHCGTCTACLDACPTGAIVAPYELDARRCISYLTIELDGAIPEELRPRDRQPHLRLRRLPARVPVEPLCGESRRCPTSPACATASTTSRWSSSSRGRGRTSSAGCRQRDPPHRLGEVAVEHRRGARQCPALGGHPRRAAGTRARRVGAGARAVAWALARQAEAAAN